MVENGIICTCTARTAQDDEGSPITSGHWDTPRSLESFRTAQAELVALNYELEERWRILPPAPDLVWADHTCAQGPDGSLAMIASRVAHSGARSLFDDQLVSVEPQQGNVRWMVHLDGGRASWDP